MKNYLKTLIGCMLLFSISCVAADATMDIGDVVNTMKDIKELGKTKKAKVLQPSQLQSSEQRNLTSVKPISNENDASSPNTAKSNSITAQQETKQEISPRICFKNLVDDRETCITPAKVNYSSEADIKGGHVGKWEPNQILSVLEVPSSEALKNCETIKFNILNNIKVESLPPTNLYKNYVGDKDVMDMLKLMGPETAILNCNGADGNSQTRVIFIVFNDSSAIVNYVDMSVCDIQDPSAMVNKAKLKFGANGIKKTIPNLEQYTWKKPKGEVVTLNQISRVQNKTNFSIDKCLGKSAVNIGLENPAYSQLMLSQQIDSLAQKVIIERKQKNDDKLREEKARQENVQF